MQVNRDQYSSALTKAVDSKDGNGDGPPREHDRETGWHRLRRQLASQLLRDVEMQRLPEALEIREQVFDGEPITAADMDILAQLVQVVDRASVLLEGEQDLGGARRGVAKLRDEIVARAQANDLAAVAVDAAMHAQPRRAGAVVTC